MTRASSTTRTKEGNRLLLWFSILNLTEQREVVRQLAQEGRDQTQIAILTRLDLESVRNIIERDA
jgi:hypothetical protein